MLRRATFQAKAGLAAALLMSACTQQPAPPPAQSSAPRDDFAAIVERATTVLDLEDASIVGRPATPHWMRDGHSFWRRDDATGEVMLVDAARNTERPFFDSDRLRASLAALGDDRPAGLSDFTLVNDEREALFVHGGRSYLLDLDTYEIRPAPDALVAGIAARTPALLSTQFPTTFPPFMEIASPDGTRIATLRGGDIWLRNAEDGSLTRVTEDAAPRFGWMNSEEGYPTFHLSWSPDSTRFAAVKLDLRDVNHLPVLRWLETPERIEAIAFPRVGEAIPAFEIAVFDAATGARRRIEPERITNSYVNILGWSGDAREVFFSTIDREHKRLEIRAADAATGVSRRVLVEESDTYIDTPMTFAAPFFRSLARSPRFLFLSERDGWRHLYLYGADGRLLRRLTEGEWPVTDIVDVDEEAGFAYFRAPADRARPYDRQLYRVPLDGGAPERLTDGAGQHAVSMSPDKRYFVTAYSTITEPPVAELRRADGALARVLSRADAGGLAALGWTAPDSLSVPAPDGRGDIHGVIYRPYNFDPSASYPVIEAIYAGPQSDFIPKSFLTFDGLDADIYGRLSRYLAAEGFVVVFLNAPGTPGLGRAYQDAVYRTWPRGVVSNHVHAIKEAARARPWMDLSRVGVWGYSWGGYMTQRALIEAPDFYRAGVAMSPVADFEDHSIYIEPFMGLPANNPEGYAGASNLGRVGEIRGRLLIMPATLDVNAPFSAAVKLIDAMIRARRRVDVMILPENNHAPTCCGRERESYAIAYAAEYLNDTLPPPKK